MKATVLLTLMLIASLAAAQVNQFYDSMNTLYNDADALFEKYHLYKKEQGLIAGIQNEIAELNNDSLVQYATIAFYNQAYGYKWVDKGELSVLIDDLIKNPITDGIEKLAVAVKEGREQGLIGQVLPAIKLQNAYGDDVDIRDLGSQYVVIDLWATWCGPCLKDMTKVPGLKAKYDFVEFYSISFDKELKKMTKFVRKKEYDWPIVFAGEGHELWDYFEVQALPHYYIINQEHRIIASTVFDLEDELETLHQELKQ